MADYLNYEKHPVGQLILNLRKNGIDHATSQRLVLEHLENVHQGEIEFIDATNPFTSLVESAAVINAAGILENNMAVRREYPALAQTKEELYLHMSDKDYTGIESLPSQCNFEVLIQYESLVNSLTTVDGYNFKQIVIPKGTQVNINEYFFLLENSVALRQYDNGVIEIVYLQNDIGSMSTLRTLKTNIITGNIRKDSNENRWVGFMIPLRQLKINTSYHPVSRSEKFSEYMDFENSFYQCIIYEQTDAGDWREINVSYTDQVYDPDIVTAIIKPLESQLHVHIPPLYTHTGKIGKQIRVDIYETLGELSIPLTDRTINDFEFEFKTIDETGTAVDYSQNLEDVSIFLFSTDRINGGRNGLTFNQLKTRVIDHTVGPTKIPITNVELSTRLLDMGYQSILNTDIVTNRIYLATRRLPAPINTTIVAPATISMENFRTTFEDLVSSNYVYNHGDRVTIPPDTLYYQENSVISIYPKIDRDALLELESADLLNQVNSKRFMYSPFYYVLDQTDDVFDLRPYQLDKPSIDNLNFVSQNVSLITSVNTDSYNIKHTNEGYLITIVTKSGDPYKKLTDDQVDLHLALKPINSTQYVYIPSTLIGTTEEDERVYEILIKSTFDIDRNNIITLTEVNTEGVIRDDTFFNLVGEVTLFYTTTEIPGYYVKDDIDDEISHHVIPPNSVCITKENLTVTFGHFLKHLWARAHSIAYMTKEKVHTDNKPIFYPDNVFERDPDTGNIFSFKENCSGVEYKLLGEKGSPMRDLDGTIIWEHRIGDPVVDSRGIPVTETINSFVRVLNLLMVEGGYYFVNQIAATQYRNEFTNLISDWVLSDMVEVDAELLEKTDIYYHPRHTLQEIQVYIEADKKVYISSTQSFQIECHVNERINLDTDLKDELKKITVITINDWIDQRILSISELVSNLVTNYGDAVLSVSVKGLGGDTNYEMVALVDNHDQFALKKRLIMRTDEVYEVEEDIDITFVNQTNN